MRIIEFEPHGNAEYVDAKASEWLVPVRHQCPCGGHPQCPACRGAGAVEAVSYPWRVRMDEACFGTLLARLRLFSEGEDIPAVGELPPRRVKAALESADMEVLSVPVPMFPIAPGVFLGREVDVEELKRVLGLMAEIADEAERREESVCWRPLT